MMKVTKVKDELKKMSDEELVKKYHELRRELFNIKLNAATAHLKDYSLFNKLRKDVARVATYLGQR